MQLKLKRTQREGGIISKTAIFCLDARVEFTAEEQRSVMRYKLHNEVIYSSEGARRAAAGSAAASMNAKAQGIGVGSVDDFLSSATSKVGHGLKAVARGAVSAMRLTITINSLRRGQHIECKSLDELLGAEDALMTACENLKAYLDTALTFDGTELVIGFDTGKPQLVAQSSPHQQLISPGHAQAALPGLARIEDANWASATDTEFSAEADWADTPPFDITSAVDWYNLAYRWRLFIGVGFVLLIALVRSLVQ